MAKKHDSSTLFLAQVGNHLEELGGLISVSPQSPIEQHAVERAILSTNMLANSASLMELEDWQILLNSYEALLKTYRDRGLPWDERIAQITSEIIEKEEQLASVGGAGAARLRKVVAQEELKAVIDELDEVHEFAMSIEMEVAEEAQEDAPVKPRQRASEPGEDRSAETEPETDTVFSHTERPLGRSISELRRHLHAALKVWESSKESITDANPARLESLTKELQLVDFYALSIGRIIEACTKEKKSLKSGTLEPIGFALEDFASITCAGSSRRIDISMLGIDNALDLRLMLPVERALQNMINDIFVRSDDQYLRVEVAIEEKYGCLSWSIRDNGTNFITDSQLDPDEYLAFYPKLRETSRILSSFRSLLAVEPDENHDTRFSFTTPVTPDGGRFLVWGDRQKGFCALANQVSELIDVASLNLKSDAQGDYLMQNGRRVPLLRLNQLYGDGPADGDRVAVIGCLEKRIAFYVAGEGEVQDGKWIRNAAPIWREMERGLVQLHDTKLPLLEAESLLNRYMNIVNTVENMDISGGGVSDDSDLSQSQATMAKDAVSPPELYANAKGGQVLVVERSETLRNTFASILSQKEITASFVDNIDAALDCLTASTPSLIISEFRVPSMAAKVLAEQLRAEGKKIPVLVTTTHQGENAQLLVDKLGVAGYISKPLNASDVLSRIEGLIPDMSPVARG